MIKKYLEIIEELTEEEMLEKQQQIIRIEVENETETIDKAKIYEPAFEGLNYKKQLLTQKHFADADKNQPCEVKKL